MEWSVHYKNSFMGLLNLKVKAVCIYSLNYFYTILLAFKKAKIIIIVEKWREGVVVI